MSNIETQQKFWFLGGETSFQSRQDRFTREFNSVKFDVFGEKNRFAGTPPEKLPPNLESFLKVRLPPILTDYRNFVLRHLSEIVPLLGFSNEELDGLAEAKFIHEAPIAKPEIVETKDGLKLVDFNFANGLTGFDQLTMIQDFDQIDSLYLLRLSQCLAREKRPILVLDLPYAETYRGKLLTAFLKSSGLKTRYRRLGVDETESLDGEVVFRNFHINRLFEQPDLKRLLMSQNWVFWTNPLLEIALGSRTSYQRFYQHSPHREFLFETKALAETSFEALWQTRDSVILRSKNPADLRFAPLLPAQVEQSELRMRFDDPQFQNQMVVQSMGRIIPKMVGQLNGGCIYLQPSAMSYFPFLVEDHVCDVFGQDNLLQHRLTGSDLVMRSFLKG